MTIDPFVVLEAVASVALSHEPDCRCLTCRAAAGDQEALARILLDLAERNE